MSRHNTVGKHKTSIRTEDGTVHVRYHNTDVVSFDDKVITLRTGGWRTNTTKLRMNQAAWQFGLGYGVSQRKGEWYISRWDKTERKWYAEVPFSSTGVHILERKEESNG